VILHPIKYLIKIFRYKLLPEVTGKVPDIVYVDNIEANNLPGLGLFLSNILLLQLVQILKKKR
jgi:hypothetical protein